MTDVEYLILVEQGGCGDNDYWTDGGYPWQGTLCKDENDKAIHYRAVEMDSDNEGLRFRDIPTANKPKPEWEEMWLGDTHFDLELAQKRAAMIVCPTKVEGAKWHDTTDPYEGCRVHALIDNPNDGAYAVITIEAEHLKAAFCKHEGLKITIGDSSVWQSQDREITVDGEGYIIENKEVRGPWRIGHGNEKGTYVIDITCRYCGAVLVEATYQRIIKRRVNEILEAIEAIVL